MFPGEYKKERVAARSMPLIFLRGYMHFAAQKGFDAGKQILVPHNARTVNNEKSAASPHGEIEKLDLHHKSHPREGKVAGGLVE